MRCLKGKNKSVGLLVTMLICCVLFVMTGCTSDVEGDGTGYIRFASSDGSRSVTESDKLMYPAENVYWAYTAHKVDGNYTVGQSEEATSAVEGVTVTEGSKSYYLKPLKDGPETGLGKVGPFSVGTWKFTLYGYLKCKLDGGVYKFSDPVYTSEKTVVIDDASIAAAKDVVFELTADTSITQGKLELGKFSLILPKGQKIFGSKPALDADGTPIREGAEVVVKIYNGLAPASDNLLAKSTTILTTDKTMEDGAFDLNYFVWEKDTSSGLLKNMFDAGDVIVCFTAEYMDEYTYSQKDVEYKYDADDYANDDGYARIISALPYPINIKAGIITKLEGEINEFIGNGGDHHEVRYDWAVAKITWLTEADNPDGTGATYSLYTNLADAVTAYTGHTGVVDTTKKYVELLNDLYFDETVSLTADVPVFTNGYSIKNLTVTGSYSLTLKLAATGRNYIFKNVKIDDFCSSSDTVWFCTDGDVGSTTAEVTVNAPNDSVFHTGKAKNVTLTAVASAEATSSAYSKGYHLGTDKDGAATVTSVSMLDITKGRVELDGSTTVETLTVFAGTAGDVALSGKVNSVVNAYRYGTVSLKRKDSGLVRLDASDAGAKATFKEITLDGNGGKTSSDKTKQYIYGIEGMYVELPEQPFATAPTGKVFMHWATVAAPATPTSNKRFADSGKLVAGSKDGSDEITALYAIWAQPVGGRIFSVAGLDRTKYHFYGAGKGTVNEITQWYDIAASAPIDAAKILKDAVYYSVNATDSKVLAVSTVTDPTASEGMSLEVGFYTATAGSAPVKVLRSAVEDNSVISATTVINGVTGWKVGTAAEYDLMKEVGISDVFLFGFWSHELSVIRNKLFNVSTGVWDEIADTDTTTLGRILPVRTL